MEIINIEVSLQSWLKQKILQCCVSDYTQKNIFFIMMWILYINDARIIITPVITRRDLFTYHHHYAITTLCIYDTFGKVSLIFNTTLKRVMSDAYFRLGQVKMDSIPQGQVSTGLEPFTEPRNKILMIKDKAAWHCIPQIGLREISFISFALIAKILKNTCLSVLCCTVRPLSIVKQKD